VGIRTIFFTKNLFYLKMLSALSATLLHFVNGSEGGAALKRKLKKKYGFAPDNLVTDDL
jgi:hypothetical protein